MEYFGRLRPTGKVEIREFKSGSSKFIECRCDCGAVKFFQSAHLISGASKSCGCLRREATSKRRTAHGMSKTRLYYVWYSMKKRCINPKVEKYHCYGGRGISYCKEWETFEGFFNSMGNRPTEKHELDRIDCDGNYEPANCRWVTRKEQRRNTRRNRMITFNGQTLCLAEWADRLSINYGTLKSRFKNGWSTERAFTHGT